MIEFIAVVLSVVPSREPKAVFIDATNAYTLIPNLPKSSLPLNQVTTPPIGSKLV